MAALPPPAEAGGFLRRHFYERSLRLLPYCRYKLCAVFSERSLIVVLYCPRKVKPIRQGIGSHLGGEWVGVLASVERFELAEVAAIVQGHAGKAG